MENIKEYVARKKLELKKYIEENNLKLRTVVVQVGNVEASNRYIAGKVKDCNEVGIDCEVRHFEESITEEDLIGEIHKLNSDDSVDGFIVQLPLPKHISEVRITEAIDYHKDIDGFTKQSLVNPATPQGIITYLEDNNFKFEDANAVVIGRSAIVGKPVAKLLLDHNCNVRVIHSKTSEINKFNALTAADLIVVATGHRNTLVDSDLAYVPVEGGNGSIWHVNQNCFIVDVGININENGKLCGDCEGVTVCEKTPVPSGCGILTRLALLSNIVKLYNIVNGEA